ncbi:MAG: DUF3127 domain-containing protein [Prevotella sp.]|nr:DUF3127 domain-containing protein [Prevotella sp.]
MEIKGKVIQVLPIVEGTSARGNVWRKQAYVLETDEKYPKKIYFEVWNDNIERFDIQVGYFVTAEVEAESREYNSRWYTTLTAYKCGVQTTAMPTATPLNIPPQQADIFPQSEDNGDELPWD